MNLSNHPDFDAIDAILAEGTPTPDGGLVLEPSPYFISDDDVNRMHYRQAAELIQVPANDRRAVLNHAHFLMNVTPGTNLSGAIWSARQAYQRLGAQGLADETREDNARLMKGAMRNR